MTALQLCYHIRLLLRLQYADTIHSHLPVSAQVPTRGWFVTTRLAVLVSTFLQGCRRVGEQCWNIYEILALHNIRKVIALQTTMVWSNGGVNVGVTLL